MIEATERDKGGGCWERGERYECRIETSCISKRLIVPPENEIHIGLASADDIHDHNPSTGSNTHGTSRQMNIATRWVGYLVEDLWAVIRYKRSW